jgi:hypothetical protein
MKGKFLLLSMVLMLCLTSEAQLNKGMWTIGGTLGYNSSSSEFQQREKNELIVSPSFGFVIGRNKIFGINLIYGNSMSENPSQNIDTKTYGAGFFYRPYYNISSRVFAFGNIGLDYATRNEKFTTSFPGSITERNTEAIGLNLSPGIAISLSRRVHLETFLGNFLGTSYSVSKNEQSGDRDKAFNFNINANPFTDLNLGIRIFLGK